MKKLVVLGMGVCMVLAFASCKSSESAYKKAYEKAKQQELAEPQVEAPVEVTPVVAAPVTGDSHLGYLLRHDPRQPLAGNLSVHPRKLLRLCLLQDRLAEAHDADALCQQHGLRAVLQASGVQGFGSRRESYGHNPDWDLCDHIHCKRRCFVPGCQIFVKDQPEIRAGQL